MLTSMEAQPLTHDHQAYSKKALFTIKIYIPHLSSPRSAYMLRKTGICPIYSLFQGDLGLYRLLWWYMGWYGLGSFWYELLSMILNLAGYIQLLSLYISALHLHLHHLASVSSRTAECKIDQHLFFQRWLIYPTRYVATTISRLLLRRYNVLICSFCSILYAKYNENKSNRQIFQELFCLRLTRDLSGSQV